MAKKVLLRDLNDIELLPITRGELIIDSSGKLAFHSTEFLATASLPGLLSNNDKLYIDQLKLLLVYSPSSISLTTDWTASGFILSDSIGFTSGLYCIQITSGSLMFSGIASVYVGKITTDDEIVLHMSGIHQVYDDGTLGRIYAKIAPSLTSDFGEIYLSTNVPLSAINNLSITMKKII